MNNLEKTFNVTLNENDLKKFKRWLKGHLSYGPVTVVFNKKDGSERTMECTTSFELVPKVEVKESTEIKKEKKKNDEVMPVYDLEAKAWKSFRWDSIKQVRFTL